MAETIDNLPLNLYTQFDINQQLLKGVPIEPGAAPPPRTAIDVSAPVYYSAELQTLLDLGKEKTTWAHFVAPENYYIQRSNTFTTHLIPSIPPEKKDVQMQRIEKTTELDRPFDLPWERDREDQEEQLEKSILIDLLTTISTIDDNIREIVGRRIEFHKG